MAKTMPSMTRRSWRGGRRERRRWRRRGGWRTCLRALFVQRINCMHGIVKRLRICTKPPEYD
jgi:hypothetical protein